MEAPQRRGSRRLPDRVYWFRRAVVLVGLLLVIGVVGWMVGGIVRLATPGATGTPATVVTPSETPPPTPPDSTHATALPGPESSSASPATATDQPTTASATPSGPVTCDAGSLSLAVSGPAQVKAGTSAILTVTVTNSGTDTCVFSLDDRLSLRIVSGTDEIWASSDCPDWTPRPAQLTLPAGGTATWPMTWDRHRSQSPCTVVPTTLNPGTYVANAQFPGVATAQLIFLLTA